VRYIKDGSATAGEDRAYIDNIAILRGSDLKLLEDFEDETYVFPMTGAWTRTTVTPFAGTSCLGSNPIGHNASTDQSFTINVQLSEVHQGAGSAAGGSTAACDVPINGVAHTGVSGVTGMATATGNATAGAVSGIFALGSALRAAFLSTEVTGYAHNAPMSTWQDLGGANHVPTTLASTYYHPKYQSSDGQPNPVPSIAFGAPYFTLPAGIFTGSTQGELFLIARKTVEVPASLSASGLWTMNNQGGSSGTQYPGTDGVMRENALSTTRRNFARGSGLLGRHVHNVRSAPGAWSVHRSGVQLHADATNSFEIPNNRYIGISGNSSSYVAQAHIYGFVYYDRVLTSSERDRVLKDIANRFMLSVTLSSAEIYAPTMAYGAGAATVPALASVRVRTAAAAPVVGTSAASCYTIADGITHWETESRAGSSTASAAAYIDKPAPRASLSLGYRVHTDGSHRYSIWVNGVRVVNTSWAYATTLNRALNVGDNTVEFRFTRTGGASAASDFGSVDNIVITRPDGSTITEDFEDNIFFATEAQGTYPWFRDNAVNTIDGSMQFRSAEFSTIPDGQVSSVIFTFSTLVPTVHEVRATVAGRSHASVSTSAQALMRRRSGLIFRDLFDRPNNRYTENYQLLDLSEAWSIKDGRLRFDSSYAPYTQTTLGVLHSQVRSEHYVQARIWADANGGIRVRHARDSRTGYEQGYHAALTYQDTVYMRNPGGGSSWTDTYWTAMSLDEVSGNVLSIHVRTGQQRIWTDGVLQHNRSDSAGNALVGKVALYTGGGPGTSIMEMDALYCMTSSVVRVSGIPAGYTVSQGEYTATADGAGVALLDLGGATLPVMSLEIRDAGDALLDTWTSEVYGGDEFEYMGATVAAQVHQAVAEGVGLSVAFGDAFREGKLVTATRAGAATASGASRRLRGVLGTLTGTTTASATVQRLIPAQGTIAVGSAAILNSLAIIEGSDRASGTVQGNSSTGAFPHMQAVGDGDLLAVAFTSAQALRVHPASGAVVGDSSVVGATFEGTYHAAISSIEGTSLCLHHNYVSRMLFDGAIAHWKLAELVGTVAEETRGLYPGSYQNGVLLNRPGLVRGSDTAARFDGVDDRVAIPNTPQLQPTAAWSAAFWVQVHALSPNAMLFGTDSSVDALAPFYVGTNATGILTAAFRRGSWSWVRAGAPLPLSATAHVVATWDGWILRLYQNGALAASSAFSVPPVAGTGEIRIGQIGSATIDEVSLFSRALSAAEVESHFGLGVGVPKQAEGSRTGAAAATGSVRRVLSVRASATGRATASGAAVIYQQTRTFVRASMTTGRALALAGAHTPQVLASATVRGVGITRADLRKHRGLTSGEGVFVGLHGPTVPRTLGVDPPPGLLRVPTD
jgi:hypothetical protein